MRFIGSMLLFFLYTLLSVPVLAQNLGTSKTIGLQDLYVRDPFVFADPSKKTYYLYASMMVDASDGKQRSGVVVYESKDLKTWKGPQVVYTTPSDNWITGAVWAPEMHHYKGKYYLFATLNSDIPWKKQASDWPAYTFRGTQIFSADSPLGPFEPFDKLPHTPIDQMALDGTLWVENGTPYMVYCHEWVEIVDGTINVVKLKPDLSAANGLPTRLFNASAADWSTGDRQANGSVSYVTDGCYLYRTKTGKLLMIWSSFHHGHYAIGVAVSKTGSVMGPWIHQPTPLFGEHGGHGMLFSTFDGRLVLTFHGPNSPSGHERAIFYAVEDRGDTLVLDKRI